MARRKSQNRFRAPDFDRALGARIRALRIAKGVAQASIAEQLGVTFQQVQKYERGASRMPFSMAIRLCDVFGVTLDMLADRGASSAVPDDVSLRAMRLARSIEGIQDERVKSGIASLVRVALLVEQPAEQPEAKR